MSSVPAQRARDAAYQKGLGEAGKSRDQGMSSHIQRDQNLFDYFVLSDDHLTQFSRNAFLGIQQGLDELLGRCLFCLGEFFH